MNIIMNFILWKWNGNIHARKKSNYCVPTYEIAVRLKNKNVIYILKYLNFTFRN